jgi:hypothetical protein
VESAMIDALLWFAVPGTLLLALLHHEPEAL